MSNREHRYSVLNRTDAGTPMGDIMRQYWLPALRSDEVVADGDPVRLKLLGEELIAFRTTSGEVGVMDHRCPHRGASLFFGRNEENGIRCVYHGWKFAADGRCLEQANLRAEDQFCSRVNAKAYKVLEKAGAIWVYMGNADTLPELPNVPILNTDQPIAVQFIQIESNWLSRLEGDLDTSHAGFLHADNQFRGTEIDPEKNPLQLTVTNLTPGIVAIDTEFGTTYGAHRPFDGTQDYWRIGHFMFPFYTITGAFELGTMTLVCTVPMDDEHHMRVHFDLASPEAQAKQDERRRLTGFVYAADYLPNTAKWYGRWRNVRNKANDYQIDREKQRYGGSFTGIVSSAAQDQAMSESMGAIPDYWVEHLGPSDLMIVKTRRRMLKVIEEFISTRRLPPGVQDRDVYAGIMGGWTLLPKEKPWLEAYADRTGHQIKAPEPIAE